MIKTIREWREIETVLTAIGFMILGMGAGLAVAEAFSGAILCVVVSMFFFVAGDRIFRVLRKYQRITCENNLFCEKGEINMDFRLDNLWKKR